MYVEPVGISLGLHTDSVAIFRGHYSNITGDINGYGAP